PRRGRREDHARGHRAARSRRAAEVGEHALLRRGLGDRLQAQSAALVSGSRRRLLEPAAGLEPAAAESAASPESAAAEPAAAGEIPSAAARAVPRARERPARETAGAERRVRGHAAEALLAANRLPDLVGADRAADEALEQQREQRRVDERRMHIVVAAALEAPANILEAAHPFALRFVQTAVPQPLVVEPLDRLLEALELVDQRVVLRAPRPRGARPEGREILANERVSEERGRLLRQIVLAAREPRALLAEPIELGFLRLDLAVGLGERRLGRVEA